MKPHEKADAIMRALNALDAEVSNRGSSANNCDIDTESGYGWPVRA
jgi:hypothetical protein